MPASAPSTLFCEQSDVSDTLSTHGMELRLDDSGNGTVDAGELARLDKCRAESTATVLSYCNAYDSAELAKSYLVRTWTAVLATRCLCRRRGNPVPASLEKEFKEVMERLERVLAGNLPLDGVGRRSPDYPTYTNTRVVHGYDVAKLRVVRPQSESTPADSPQSPDWPAEYIHPFERGP